MDRERDPDYAENTESSLPLKDERFTSAVKEIIEDSISEGATPLGAALEAGISKRLFNSWITISDDFRDWIEGLVALHLSRRRRKVNQLIDNIEGDGDEDTSQFSMIKAAELNMKYLQSADKEFGAKHQKTTIDTNGKEVITPEAQDRIDIIKEKNAIVEEATKLANEPEDSD